MEIRIKVRHEGGDADRGELELYNGTTSIHGFAQAFNIVTHAYLHSAVIKKATALKGAKLFLRAAQRGSFVTEIVILIEQNPGSAAMVGTFAAAPFYDFAKVVFKKATGLFNGEEAETASIQKALVKNEPFFDDVAEVLEGSLQRSHRPIGEGVDTISIERPRSTLLGSVDKVWHPNLG